MCLLYSILRLGQAVVTANVGATKTKWEAERLKAVYLLGIGWKPKRVFLTLWMPKTNESPNSKELSTTFSNKSNDSKNASSNLPKIKTNDAKNEKAEHKKDIKNIPEHPSTKAKSIKSLKSNRMLSPMQRDNHTHKRPAQN